MDDPAVKVAINVTPLLTSWTGVGQYTFELASRLRALDGVEPHFFHASRWLDDLPTGDAPAEAPNGPTQPASRRSMFVRAARRVPLAYRARDALRAMTFRRSCTRRSIDLYHEPNFLAADVPVPTVVTVHDLSLLHHPETHPPERLRAFERGFESSVRRAKHVLTDSEAIRQEVIDYLGLPADRVTATLLGANPAFRPHEPAETRVTLEPLDLRHGRYLIAVGTLEPRKNLVTALQAYRGLPAAVRERFPLVVVGARGWRTKAIERVLRPLETEGTVRRLGYVARDDLVRLMAGARALVYPSLYEGFGLPPLEAMACGVPVVTSNVSSLPEVVGSAGTLVDPMDDEAIRDALRVLVEDDAEHQRFVEAGIARSKRFSWDRTARATLSVYRSVLGLDAEPTARSAGR